MRILLWHGYLLTGTGSNIHTANLARVWRAAGHDVLLLCQERQAARIGWVDAAGDFDATNTSFSLRTTGHAAAAGRVRVARPFISGLLPVYVYDDYEGFTVKRFVDLDDGELERYTTANVDALTTATDEFAPDVILVGHEVMGPFIALQAQERTGHPYAVKLHGSALEYAVKEQARYLAFAEEGLRGAARVIGGSAYMVDEAASIVPGWRDRATVVNPGCDVNLFRPQARPPGRRPTVAYVGKLIAAKGVHNLIAACGLVEADMNVVIVGFGGFEPGLRSLHAALVAGDLERARRIAREGETGPLVHLERFLRSDVGPGYLERMGTLDLTFAGRMNHDELSRSLPTYDVLVAPSVVNEAFGMVAAEAAASGVLPIVPDHSGISEAGRTIEQELGRPGLLRFDPGDPIRGIARRLEDVLALPEVERDELGESAAHLARRIWSWEHVGESALAAVVSV